MQSFNMSAGHFPAGVIDPSPGPIVSRQQGFHHSWIIQLLPYIDEQNLYRLIDQEKSVYDEKNRRARETFLSVLTCPSAEQSFGPIAISDYAGVQHDVEAPINSDNRGVLYLNSRVTRDQITDGAQYTLLLGEKLTPERNVMGWMSGTRATLRNTGTPLNQTQPLAVPRRVVERQTVDTAAGVAITEAETTLPEDAVGDERSSSPPTDDNGEASDDELDQPDQKSSLEASQVVDDTDAKPGDADAPGDYVAAEVTDEDGTEVSQLTETQEAIDPKDPWAAAKQAGLYVGGFGSHHTGGAAFAFADGHIKFLTDDIDQQVYQNMGSRDDGQLIDSRLLD